MPSRPALTERSAAPSDFPTGEDGDEDDDDDDDDDYGVDDDDDCDDHDDHDDHDYYTDNDDKDASTCPTGYVMILTLLSTRDPFWKGRKTCMNFARSLSSPSLKCGLQTR